MKNDIYLKIVLTIIAVCLVWNVVKPITVRTATAGPEVIRVDIVAVGGRSVGREVPVTQSRRVVR